MSRDARGRRLGWRDLDPVTGCTEVSEGCDHCYAKTFAERFRGVPGHPFEQGFDVKLWPQRLGLPLTWRKSCRVFLNSMSDLWHDSVPDEFIAAVWATMFWTSSEGRPPERSSSPKPLHTYQILTKRAGRMRSWVSRWGDSDQRVAWIESAAERSWCDAEDVQNAPSMPPVLPNAWLGVSVETRRWARVRLPELARTPAAVRFASCEPALRDFEQAEQLLLPLRTLAARNELITLYQYRGQAAFFAADWEQCGQWLTQAENVARTTDLVPQLAAILCHQGLALISLGRQSGPQMYDHGIERLEESLRLYKQAGVRPFVWRVLFFRALCDIEAVRWPHADTASPSVDERIERAVALMEAASKEIDYLRRASEDGASDRRQQVWTAFSVDKQTFYEQAFQLAWDVRRDERAAWVWLERAKGRALLDALGESENESDTAVLAATTPDLRRDAAAHSAPMGYDEIRALLAAERARTGRRIVLAQYLCTPTRTLMFIATADRERPEVLTVPIDHTAVREFSTATFRATGGVRMMEQDLADGGAQAWHRFAALVEPLGRHAQPDDVIYLAPHGVLHDLPLHTLPLNGLPLIERNPVCYVPTAAVLRHTLGDQRRGQTSPDAAAVFGDPRHNLPNAREEAVEIARLLGVEPVLGADADRDRVLSALADAGLVHIAGHGRISTSDGFDSFMELAGQDTLRAADLLPLRSGARLVVLSGCETGVSEQRPGEELIGFTRALLLSGVPAILSSQWRVGDASTRELLSRFHQAASDPSVTPADALRRAILDVRARPGLGHLYHWGGFVLVGSWR